MTNIDDKSGNQPAPQAFEAVFNYHVRGLLAYAKEYVRTQEEAEDIVSEVFANFWERMDEVSGDAVKTYLFRSIRNKSLTRLTHIKVRTKYQDEILKHGSPPLAFDPDLYIAGELQSRIEAAIEKLPSRRKAAFVMNRFEKKTFAQIAVELNISPRTVDKHVQLALAGLRKELADFLPVLLAMAPLLRVMG